MTASVRNPADGWPAAERRWSQTRQTLRRLRGPRRRTASWGYWTYVALLAALPLGLAIADALRANEPLAGEAAILLERGAVAGSGLLLAVTALGLRFAAWHGAVVVSRADIAWLLAAPLPRGRVLGPRLIKLLAALSATGGLLGLLAGAALALALGVPGPVGWLGLAGMLSGAAAGLTGGAAAWLVQCRPRWSRAVLRAAPAALLVGAAAAVGGWQGAVPDGLTFALVWSGPWGWALVPPLTVATSQTPWLAAAWAPAAVSGLLLAGAAVAAVAAALRGLRAVPIQELRRREAASTSLLASAAYAADLRTGAQARRQAITGLIGRRLRSRRAPPSPNLAVPWAAALLLGRARERVAHAVVVVAVAAVVATGLWQSGWQTATIPVTAAVVYLAASALVEPLRIELEERLVSRSGPWTLPQVLGGQAPVPAALLTLLLLVPVAGATLAGYLEAGPALALVACAPLAALLLTTSAVAVATGPGPDARWLYSGDMGMTLLFAHYTQGAHLAAALIGMPGLTALAALAAGAPLALVLLGALAWTAIALTLLARWSARRLRAFH